MTTTRSGARFIDIHLLHTVPYANLNRDDLGSPKTVRFGGVDRTRVSSQCWKRAVRLELENLTGDAAARTRRVPLEVANRLRHAGWADDVAATAGQQIAAAITGKGLALEPNGGTSVLLYLPKSALDDLAAVCIEHHDALTAATTRPKPKKGEKQDTILPRDRVNEIITSRNGVINLFGRMLADAPSAHVDGAVQVAHAFTVHDTSPEVDFFTAVDDLTKDADESGSGHMNNAEFSAGTFYRYASVNLADLRHNVTDWAHKIPDDALAARLAADFLHAFITAIPGAKKNSTAPFTLPDLAYITVRADRPVSLASAFEAPVRAAYNGGYATRASAALDDYTARVHQLLAGKGLLHHAHATTADKPLDNLGARVTSYDALVHAAIAATENR